MPRTTPTSSSRDLAMVAVFAGVIAALGLIPAITPPVGGAVPITAQTLGVMLAGAILGSRRGASAVVLFLALVALGLPLLASGRGGLGVLAGPSLGYFIGWVVGAFVIGALTYALGAPYRLVPGLVAALVGGVVVIHVLGIIGMMVRADLSLQAAVIADLVFVPGDVLKAVLCALVARGVHTAYPGLLPERRSSRVAEPADASV